MASKIILLACAVACVRAGFIGAPSAEIRYAAPGPFLNSAPLTYAQPAPVLRAGPAFIQSTPIVRAAPTLVHSAPILRAGPTYIQQSAPIVKAAPVIAKAEEYDPNPQYSFGYDVHDSLTGDIKSQSETRNGDAVQGSYALNEPDGTRRIVEYTADPINGFNAVVRKEPLGEAIVKAAPIAAAPIAYGASPVVKTTTYLH